MTKAHKDAIPVTGMFENWFLDYASYVILERAIPALEDGLKPVQRRILHAMYQMDDGRYNKVANIIGQAMQYHPHGDASISDAIVNIGQKDLLIDPQGNWGDIRTGDSAAASRYIEARLTPFASEVIFNPETTEWQLSYDGRKKEPINLPVKFPLLLAQGVEGIAVGLSTKVLPHNFCELIEASIDILRNKNIDIVPDFPTGGMMDATNYNGGQKGGKVRVRAKMEKVDSKTLAIREIPFSTTTTSLIESILKAADQGKIKVKNVVDNTAQAVEILVTLPNNVSPEVTMDALYAFTDCEVSISPNACVVIDNKPKFFDVNELLKVSTNRTKDLLEIELILLKQKLQEQILTASLEKIFIENRVYRDIEEAETWEEVIQMIDKGLTPYKKDFYREITEEDIIKLTEIRIKRISKYDTFKAAELMKKYETQLATTEDNLANLTRYAINYFKNLLKKYGKGRERRTQIATFGTIQATKVVANNTKLYVNKADGFIGTSLKKDEFVCECSDIDDIVVIREDGKLIVTKIDAKTFVGKNILHVEVFDKNDKRLTYNMVYRDGLGGKTYVKRFQVGGVTRDKEYILTKKEPKSKVLYFSANPNGEAEVVTVTLNANARARNKVFDYDFADLDIKGRGSIGNILTKYPVKKIVKTQEGISTLGSLKVYYDPLNGTLNADKRGELIGKLEGTDQLLALYKDGSYELRKFDLAQRYDERNVLSIEKYDPEQVITAVYWSGEHKQHFVKRFIIETTTLDKPFVFIPETKGTKLLGATIKAQPQIEVKYKKKGQKELATFTYDLDVLAEIKGWKALGHKIPQEGIKEINFIDSTPQEEKSQLDLF
ncbi:MAG: DNA gyrase/topoisomerase IV subunit A [Thermonemataceae bacterium]